MRDKPPAAGKGRPKHALNKTTVAMKDAIIQVYNDLQEEAGGDHAHFKKWANDNPTDFYKIASKLVPLGVFGSLNVALTVDQSELRREAAEEVRDIFGDDALGPLIEHK